jgi:hemin uptake protein HemP
MTNEKATSSLMQAPLPNDLRPAGAPPTPSDPPASAEGVAAAVDSSTLLQGHKAVAISHNGSVYRLQATKLGKLILTK